MHIAIIALPHQQKIVLSKPIDNAVQLSWIDSFTDVVADAYISLLNTEIETNSFKHLDKPVFIHSLTQLSAQLPPNYIRVNAWNTFLERETIEMVFDKSMQKSVDIITQLLGWKYVNCADNYGMIGARIVSMIINEAYFALSENVSSKEEIDIAMRLGTNYPFGPFEWAEKIGINNVVQLLNKLSVENKMYLPATAFIAANNKLV